MTFAYLYTWLTSFIVMWFSLFLHQYLGLIIMVKQLFFIVHSWVIRLLIRLFGCSNNLRMLCLVLLWKWSIIDQDPAMTKAIFQALLPQTFHRYFSWHILNKFYEKINAIKHKDCFSDFQSYIWNSYSQEEFNSLWMDIIEHN